MGVLDKPIVSRSKKKKMRANENLREDQDRSTGLQDVLSVPRRKMAPSGPPCGQQLSAQTKVHSKEKYEADISAARDGKRLRFATRFTLRRNHPSKILPSNTPDFSVMFSAGRAFIEMDPFAKELRGSITALASVVSSHERSAATERDEEQQNSIS